MYQYTDRRCRKCLLQEDPSCGLTLDADGLCPLCRSYRPVERDWPALGTAFAARIESLRGQGGEFEAALMMSGGKDSAYLASLLGKHHGLRLLGLTIDNGFEYQETFDHARKLARNLDIPLEVLRPDPAASRALYRFLLTSPGLMERDFGQLCLFCGRFLLDTALAEAGRRGIGTVFVGYNPEQLFGMGQTLPIETDRLRIRQQEAIAARIGFLFRKAAALAATHPDKALLPPFTARPDSGCAVVAPFLYLPYRPQEIMDVARRETGWTPISSFSPRHYLASGCRLLKLMAALARINEVPSYMDHEFASQVRSGDLEKETLRKYYDGLEEQPAFYADILRELGLSCSLETLAAGPSGRGR